MKASLYIFLVLWIGAGCIEETAIVRRQPVPSLDKLRLEDCELGIAAYRQLLQRPPHAGVVVTGRPPAIPSAEEQELAVIEFSSLCQRQLVGQARRAIVRCWTDAADTVSFRRCNERF